MSIIAESGEGFSGAPEAGRESGEPAGAAVPTGSLRNTVRTL